MASELFSEQKLTNQFKSTTKMPSFYAETERRHFLHSSDPDSIDKDQLIVQIFQHWKLKAHEHQHRLNNTNENLLRKNDIESVREEKPPQKVIGSPPPPPSLFCHQNEALRENIVTPSDSINTNLLCVDGKRRVSAGSISSIKRNSRSLPIFIAPKKTPTLISTRPFALPSFEGTNNSKTKSNVEEISNSFRSHTINSNSFPVGNFHRTNNNKDEDDEGSSDEERRETWMIRKRDVPLKPKQRKENCSFVSTKFNIPTAILLTDPNGNSKILNIDEEEEEEEENENFLHENSSSTTNNDKRILQSIGEEDEDKESKLLVSRRWSDLNIDEKKQTTSQSNNIGSTAKRNSAASVDKSVTSAPFKLSKAKYFLMKLHLTSAPNKEEQINSTNPTIEKNSKRIVCRSSDKKRYQTR